MAQPSRSVELLAAYLADGGADAAGLAERLAGSARFRAFAEANRDKIRKKLRGAADATARADVLAELDVALRLLADRRIELLFEAYGVGKRGPDFTVVFRANHRFNVEVTRPRGDDAAGAVLAKLRQLPSDLPNVVVVVVDGTPPTSDELAAAMRSVKERAEGKQYQQLTVVLVVGGDSAAIWPNPEARRRLPDAAELACLRCWRAD